MRKSKWTPKPWSTPHFARPDVNCECGYVLVDGTLGAVAKVFWTKDGAEWRVYGDSRPPEECFGNAFLISAAPDLYEALKRLVDEIAELDRPRFALEDARAVLAKANPPQAA